MNFIYFHKRFNVNLPAEFKILVILYRMLSTLYWLFLFVRISRFTCFGAVLLGSWILRKIIKWLLLTFWSMLINHHCRLILCSSHLWKRWLTIFYNPLIFVRLGNGNNGFLAKWRLSKMCRNRTSKNPYEKTCRFCTAAASV